jgi:soluble lytic murein transglycosylase-like protein
MNQLVVEKEIDINSKLLEMINVIFSRVNYVYSKLISYYNNIPENERIKILPQNIKEASAPQASFNFNFDFYNNRFKNKILGGHTLKFKGKPIRNVTRWNDIVGKASRTFGIPKNLLFGIIHQESTGDPNITAGRRKMAVGLMQLREDAAREVGLTVNRSVDERFDPEKNIYAGARYFSGLLKQFNGDVSMAIAAYHEGPAGIKKVRNMIDSNNIHAAREKLGTEGIEYLPRVLQLTDAYLGL